MKFEKTLTRLKGQITMHAKRRRNILGRMRVAIVVLLLAVGCATPTKPPEPVAVSAQDQKFAVRNQGYSLLYQLVSDEKDVSKLLLVKKEAPDVGGLLKDVSRVSGEAARQLEAFEKADAHLHLKMTGLPVAEQQTRDLISKTKAKELITKAGEKFEVRILLSQAEALSYGAHLAVVTQSYEENPDRKKLLAKISEEYQGLHQRLIDLIHARWREPVPPK
jgi:hypothetical protein